MIVRKELLADVLNAQLRELRLVDHPGCVEGDVLPLQAAATSRAVCHIRVNEVVAEGDRWVVRFHRVAAPDRARFLAADSTRGYTSDPSRALRGEPEPVPEDWQERITDASETRVEHAWQKTERILNRMTFEQRLFLAARVAAVRGLKVRGDLRRIVRNKNRGQALATLKRLEKRVHRR